MEYSWFELYWLPALGITILVIAVGIALAWVLIFTAVRAALRSWHDEEREIKRGGRFERPPR